MQAKNLNTSSLLIIEIQSDKTHTVEDLWCIIVSDICSGSDQTLDPIMLHGEPLVLRFCTTTTHCASRRSKDGHYSNNTKATLFARVYASEGPWSKKRKGETMD